MNSESLTLIGPHHATESPVVAVVANWHDEHHSGAFLTCREQPCDAVRNADAGDY